MTPLRDRLGRAFRAMTSSEPSPDAEEVPALDESEVREARSFFPREKFFVFGYARSGTTLLARLLRVHPEVHCQWQGHFFTRPPLLSSLVASPEVRAWLRRRSNRWNRGKDLAPVILRAVSDYVLERDAAEAGKRIVGDKSPNGLLQEEAVRLVKGLYPDARLLFIVRDGRDVAVSHRVQSFLDAAETLSRTDRRIRAGFLRDPESYLRGEPSLFTPAYLEHEAVAWTRNVLETDRMARDLFGPAYAAVRFEDLIARPGEEMERLWQALGARPTDAAVQEAIAVEMRANPDASWQREKGGAGVVALSKGVPGSWKNAMHPDEVRRFETHALAGLRRWGYAPDLQEA